MTDVALSPRTRVLFDRIDAWSSRSRSRGLLVRLGVTVTGPLVVLVGVAMLVLPGPGLVVMAAGTALLALEYEWARALLGLAGRAASWVRRAALPKDGSAGRRLLGLTGGAAFVVATTALTATVTTYLSAQTFL
jgi:uncharacterized protein (TIGR02611 family)